MLFPNIFGGFDTRDLPNLGVDDVGRDRVMADIRRWAEYFDRVVQLYERIFARRTTQATGNFGAGTADGEMQPFGEYAATEATRTGESGWAWGAPIRAYRDEQMYTEQYLQTKNLDQINRDTIAATNRAFTTRLKMILRAILGNANWVFQDRQFPGSDKGPITVYRLFNNDGTVAQLNVNGTIVAAGTLQSYVPSGAAAVSLTNFSLGRSKLRTRGLLGRVVHIASPTDGDTIRGLAGFVPIASADAGKYVVTQPPAPQTTAVAARPETIGAFSTANELGEVVLFPFWPAGYTMSMDVTAPVPVIIREHENALFRGFKLINDETRADYGSDDLRNKTWEYIAGAGIENRANGTVVQATTGAYAVPTV